jgi:hypothetical protein
MQNKNKKHKWFCISYSQSYSSCSNPKSPIGKWKNNHKQRKETRAKQGTPGKNEIDFNRDLMN